MDFNFEKDMNILVSKLSRHIKKPNTDESILTGFIDYYGNLYPITLDTKVLSKVVEFIFIPIIKEFCDENGYELIEPKYQNYYPDLTFVNKITGEKYAVDIKTTYRITEKIFSYDKTKYLVVKNKKNYILYIENKEEEKTFDPIKIFTDSEIYFPQNEFVKKIKEVTEEIKNNRNVNGMTLGAYSGYFKNRNISKNITYPYNQYKGHYILGLIYSREENHSSLVNRIENYRNIESPIYDIKMFFIEKYKIASKKPGSGNTKNIGSVKTERELVYGLGDFASIEEFDNYWMNYY